MRTTPLISRFARMARRQVLGAALAMLASALLGPSLLATEPGKPLRVVVISDLNESYGSTWYSANVGEAVPRRIRELQPDLVISTGDRWPGQRLAPLARARRRSRPCGPRSIYAVIGPAVWPPAYRFAVDAGKPRRVVGLRGSELERGDLPGAVAAAPAPGPDFVDCRWATRSTTPSWFGPVSVRCRWTRRYVGRLCRPRERRLAGESLLLSRGAPAHRHRVVFSHIPLWPSPKGRETDYLGDEELDR